MIKRIFIFSFLFFSAITYSFIYGDDAEMDKERADEEWVEYLNTPYVSISAPISDHITYTVANGRYHRTSIYRNYLYMLNSVLETAYKGFNIYEVVGRLDSDYIVFYYHPTAKHKKRLGTMLFDSRWIPCWISKDETDGEAEKQILKMMLSTPRSFNPIGPVKISKADRDGVKYNVLRYKTKPKDEGDSERAVTYYRANKSNTVLLYFTIFYYGYKDEKKDIDNMFYQIIDTSVYSDHLSKYDETLHALDSANELEIWAYRDKPGPENINVLFESDSTEKIIDVRSITSDDSEHVKKIIFEELNQISRECPDNPKIFYCQGVLSEYNSSGGRYGEGFDKEAAEKFYKKAIEADNKFAYAYYNLGILAARGKEFKKAIGYFKRCIEIAPIDVLSHVMIAEMYERLNDNENAYDYYAKLAMLITDQEKEYSPKLADKIKKKEKELRMILGLEKARKKAKNKYLSWSAMASELKYENTMQGRMLTVNSFRGTKKNVFSFDTSDVFWVGFFKKPVKSNNLLFKWIAPDGRVYRTDKGANRLGLTGLRHMPLWVATYPPSRKVGCWNVEVYHKEELIDSKYFYILDA